ncbi:Acyl-[acyl-carrier-protein]--UDP-N-acetylglucosamine O-acyltransferase [Galdieria sulphuraria]|uniref:Acyl-[ACP]-UDP-N-acetylglucosamine O-acyltransferase isoform 1 n=1 Tax=Galdieria sulphuraria TaxID=130081 RepID=M2XVS2_GALSU|nr:acyl-[ACP]-UDP-N-acetylglucosamine O-acyltransferase isoform 1 [Galdieria sulphuraria]EME27748.1 acyl-[ACP]-UDP-N-acetylglucosamine O-acyltransferase isoform 1 [Galdieria sulphuraria]GJD10161.1 Acyl-[acyl-carrier-protein]--UDP-N-acetylglucosamine O-acyltransferase [Galdieria sulphuraria]|eukprot:XP_005704268.1 acyl-[ACP]-UDP-N-acetylglucosamine O-acyltransferase isoform 1 [Galdieria sulphuraria]
MRWVRFLVRPFTRKPTVVISQSDTLSRIFLTSRNLYTQVAETCCLGDGVQLDDFCKLGPNTVVGANSKIGRFTEIGSDCHIGSFVRLDSHVLVDSNTMIGDHCTVYPFAVLGYRPQDKKYKGEQTGLEIGSRCQIRENVKIERGTSFRNKTVIGNDVLLMSNVYVGHDSWLHDHVTVANNVSIAGHVELHPYCVIGGHSALHQFVRIGQGAMIGGMAAIRRDVPPFCLVTGTPPRIRCLNYHQVWKKVTHHKHRKWMKQSFDYLFDSDDVSSIHQRAQHLLSQCSLSKDVSAIARYVIQEMCTFILSCHSSVRGLLTLVHNR